MLLPNKVNENKNVLI